jgi:hypothetical protein
LSSRPRRTASCWAHTACSASRSACPVGSGPDSSMASIAWRIAVTGSLVGVGGARAAAAGRAVCPCCPWCQDVITGTAFCCDRSRHEQRHPQHRAIAGRLSANRRPNLDWEIHTSFATFHMQPTEWVCGSEVSRVPCPGHPNS